ncbi:lipopolysaccharide assembly protein LapA domain-containing protein [Geminicoccaceae bacterium 1502E]|nr:lipopolysaccharide assembly protein LapA domain-containing protein [Geminicoccaceae bacterium 1502E]
MLKIIRLLLAVAAAVAIILFAVANRQPVDVSFWPTPFVTDMPLWGVFVIGLLVGVLVGGVASWLAGWKSRREGRQARRRVVALEAREQLRREEQARAEAQEVRQRRERTALAHTGS